MRGAALVVVLIGCDVPGADLDGDGIADADDPCQTSDADDVVDIDGDGKDATQDLCPHDKNAIAGDRDSDGIPDACDLFVDDIRPDRRQCVTSFGVRWMNAAYLGARPGEVPFDLTPPLEVDDRASVAAFAIRPLDFPTVSFDLVGHFDFDEGGSDFALWLRAGETPSPADVGCGFDASGSVYVLAEGQRHAMTGPWLLPGNRPFRLRAAIGGSRANVLCQLTTDGMLLGTTTFETPLPPSGRWGFSAAGGFVRIDSLVIDTNDIAVPYRYSSH